MPTYRKKFDGGDIVAVCPPGDANPFFMTVSYDGIVILRGRDKYGDEIQISKLSCDIVPVLGSARCAKCNRRLPKVTHNKTYCAACQPLRKSERQREWNRKYQEAGK